MVDRLGFDVQGGGGLLPNSDPFGQTEKEGRALLVLRWGQFWGEFFRKLRPFP